MKYTSRTWFLIGALFALTLIAVAVYFQYVTDLEPCPLCITQRVIVLITGIVLLIAALHNPGNVGTRVYAITGFLIALAGAAIAGRHVWLQNLPADQVPACGPGIEYMFKNFPLGKAFEMLFKGTGECAEVLWTFIGLSIPAWTLIAFILLGGISLLQLWNPILTSEQVGK